MQDYFSKTRLQVMAVRCLQSSPYYKARYRYILCFSLVGVFTLYWLSLPPLLYFSWLAGLVLLAFLTSSQWSLYRYFINHFDFYDEIKKMAQFEFVKRKKQQDSPGVLFLFGEREQLVEIIIDQALANELKLSDFQLELNQLEKSLREGEDSNDVWKTFLQSCAAILAKRYPV